MKNMLGHRYFMQMLQQRQMAREVYDMQIPNVKPFREAVEVTVFSPDGTINKYSTDHERERMFSRIEGDFRASIECFMLDGEDWGPQTRSYEIVAPYIEITYVPEESAEEYPEQG